MTSQFKAADTMDRGPSWRALIAALFTVLSVVGAACTTSPGTGQVDDPGPAPSSLPAPVSTHGDGKVSLEWTVEGAPPGATYEWEWRKYGTQVWSSQPTSEPQVELSTVLDARTTYWARVRWVDGETLGEWSSGAKFFYADLTLPVLRIDTDGGAPIIDKENYLGATISIDPNGSGDTAYSPARTEIKGRGNSTWGAPKKPYKLKLSSKASLLGMPASKHWVLLANFFDPSHLRNEIAFQLSKQTSLAWTPRFRFVEVILNGSYDGLYMLGEHIRVEPTRVNIDEMDENDLEGEALTGGYLMEFDFRFNPSIDPGFVSSTGLKVEVKDPEPVEPQQLSYINSYFNSFEAATLGSSFKDPSLGYAAYLDVDKFIDWYLIAELARQQDGMMSSTYVSKPRNGKLPCLSG